ncbi:hypothetical protein HY642_07465 [Candidatus Woesearchaeota archaeon]|nr:hypothetical protein [Candidatus Woesearchaeota archaeon]
MKHYKPAARGYRLSAFQYREGEREMPELVQQVKYVRAMRMIAKDLEQAAELMPEDRQKLDSLEQQVKDAFSKALPQLTPEALDMLMTSDADATALLSSVGATIPQVATALDEKVWARLGKDLGEIFSHYEALQRRYYGEVCASPRKKR